MKTGKFPGMDDIPSERISNGVEGTVKALTDLCQNIWEQKKWSTEWTKSLAKKGNLRQWSERQGHKLDQPTKQGDPSFGAAPNTVERIFNCRVIIAKHLEHQRDVYHNFTGCKKAFDRVCHGGLWKVLISSNIDGGLHKSSGLYATIPAARYSGQSTRRIFPDIPSASDRGV